MTRRHRLGSHLEVMAAPRTQVQFCYGHVRWETFLPHSFRSCVECGHQWRTAKDLIMDDQAMVLDMKRNWPKYESNPYEGWCPPIIPTDAASVWRMANTIYTCPVCTHDF